MFSSGNYTVQGNTSPDALALSLFTGPGSFDFDYVTSAGFGSGGPPNGSVSATLDLVASSAQVTYTYTDALPNGVPEPSSMVLVSLASFAAFVVRRRPRSALHG